MPLLYIGRCSTFVTFVAANLSLTFCSRQRRHLFIADEVREPFLAADSASPIYEYSSEVRWKYCFSDLSDVPENLPLPAPGSESPPQALNYSQIASAAVAVSQSAQDPSVSSTETLLRNIQGLLKVAADNARQQERQINYEKGQWQGFLKTLEGALHNFIIFQLSQNHIKRH